MRASNSLTTQQIGKLGELLTQFVLLRHGIESAPLTTDSGIDLVAYSHDRKRAMTIQVKANLKPKPGGGLGHASLDWWAPDDSPADFFAFVNVKENQIWFLTKGELKEKAQQHPKGRYHFYITVDPESEIKGKKGKDAHISKFENYRLENRIKDLF
jgi:hypothetical protein